MVPTINLEYRKTWSSTDPTNTYPHRSGSPADWHKVNIAPYNDILPTSYTANGLDPGTSYDFIISTTSTGRTVSEDSDIHSGTTLQMSELHVLNGSVHVQI